MLTLMDAPEVAVRRPIAEIKKTAKKVNTVAYKHAERSRLVLEVACSALVAHETILVMLSVTCWIWIIVDVHYFVVSWVRERGGDEHDA